MHKAFVYGSLKRGFGNHCVIEGGEFVGEAVTEDNSYNMFSMGGFPGVTLEGDHHIRGELFDVDDNVLAGLDRLEGNGSFYTRQEVQVEMVKGDPITAWMYLLPADEYNHIADHHDRVHIDDASQIWMNYNE